MKSSVLVYKGIWNFQLHGCFKFFVVIQRSRHQQEHRESCEKSKVLKEMQLYCQRCHIQFEGRERSFALKILKRNFFTCWLHMTCGYHDEFRHQSLQHKGHEIRKCRMKDHEWNSKQISIRKNTSVYKLKQSSILKGVGFGAKLEGDLMQLSNHLEREDFYFKIVLGPSPLFGQMFVSWQCRTERGPLQDCQRSTWNFPG